MWREKSFRSSFSTGMWLSAAFVLSFGCANDKQKNVRQPVDNFVRLDLPEGATIETSEKDQAYRIKWKDENGQGQRAVVTILQNSRLNTDEQLSFLETYESAMRSDSMAFERTKDQPLDKQTRQVEFKINIGGDSRSSSTIALLMGAKVVEVILPHPSRENPDQSQLNFVKNLKGV